MSKKSKLRLFEILIKKGLAESKREAISLILQHKVKVDGKLISGVSSLVQEDSKVEIMAKLPPFVSRAGEKLFNLLTSLGENAPKIKDSICLDIGCGTGGFTQVLLQLGAKKVYAVDVGKGIIDAKIRNDRRVVLLEQVNARNLTLHLVPEPISLFTMDVSFISGTLILRNLHKLNLEPRDKIIGIYLVKPQFERELDPSDEKSGGFRRGIIKSKSLLTKTLNLVYDKVIQAGFGVDQIHLAKPRGIKGNYEFFFLLTKVADGVTTQDKQNFQKYLEIALDQVKLD